MTISILGGPITASLIAGADAQKTFILKYVVFG